MNKNLSFLVLIIQQWVTWNNYPLTRKLRILPQDLPWLSYEWTVKFWEKLFCEFVKKPQERLLRPLQMWLRWWGWWRWWRSWWGSPGPNFGSGCSLLERPRRTWDCVNASHRKLCEFCISTNLVITSIVIIFVIIERRTWWRSTSASTTCLARSHPPSALRWKPQGRIRQCRSSASGKRVKNILWELQKFSLVATEQGNRSLLGKLLLFLLPLPLVWKWTCRNKPWTGVDEENLLQMLLKFHIGNFQHNEEKVFY